MNILKNFLPNLVSRTQAGIIQGIFEWSILAFCISLAFGNCLAGEVSPKSLVEKSLQIEFRSCFVSTGDGFEAFRSICPQRLKFIKKNENLLLYLASSGEDYSPRYFEKFDFLQLSQKEDFLKNFGKLLKCSLEDDCGLDKEITRYFLMVKNALESQTAVIAKYNSNFVSSDENLEFHIPLFHGRSDYFVFDDEKLLMGFWFDNQLAEEQGPVFGIWMK